MNPLKKFVQLYIRIPRIWARSHEVWEIKQDNNSSPTIFKLPADHVYCMTTKKNCKKDPKKLKENNIKGSYIKFYMIVFSSDSSN